MNKSEIANEITKAGDKIADIFQYIEQYKAEHQILKDLKKEYVLASLDGSWELNLLTLNSIHKKLPADDLALLLLHHNKDNSILFEDTTYEIEVVREFVSVRFNVRNDFVNFIQQYNLVLDKDSYALQLEDLEGNLNFERQKEQVAKAKAEELEESIQKFKQLGKDLGI